MKKILAVTIILAVFCGPGMAEDEEHHPSMAVMFDPLSTGIGIGLGIANVSLEFQVAFSDYVGMSIAPVFAYYKTGDIEVYGGGFEIGPRFFFSGKKLSGFYAYPLVSFAWAAGENSSNSDSASGGGIFVGAELGYSWTWTPGFMMYLGAGAGYFKYLGDLSEYEPTWPVQPRIRFALGYGW